MHLQNNFSGVVNKGNESEIRKMYACSSFFFFFHYHFTIYKIENWQHICHTCYNADGSKVYGEH